MIDVSRLGALAIAAVLLSGCVGKHGLTYIIQNRSPDDVVFEMIPEGVADPLTSPQYVRLSLKRKASQEIDVIRGMYHFRVEVDDWEGKRTIRHDELLNEDGRIEILRNDIRVIEIKDPVRHGRVD